MFDLIDTLHKLYQAQILRADSYANLIEVKVRAAAGLGALIYIFSRLLGQIARNEAIDFLPYLRPFLLVCLIASAPKFCTLLDEFGQEITDTIDTANGSLHERVKKQTTVLQKKVEAKWEKMGSDPQLYKDTFGSDLEQDREGIMGDMAVDFKIWFGKVSEDFKFQLFSFTQDILLAIMQVAEAVLFLLSMSYRLVLRMGAPIAFAIAIFPGFTGNIAEWFGKYLNYVLLPAVAAMYGGLAFAASEAYLAYYDAGAAVVAGGSEAQQPEFLGLAYIALLVMLLIGYLQVPSMTQMIVSVGGVGAMVHGATRVASRTAQSRPARAITRGAAGAVGGAAGAGLRVAGGTVQGIGSAIQTMPGAALQAARTGYAAGSANGSRAGGLARGAMAMVGSVGASVVRGTVGAGVSSIASESKLQAARALSQVRRVRNKVNKL
jgi:hypothetical protein